MGNKTFCVLKKPADKFRIYLGKILTDTTHFVHVLTLKTSKYIIMSDMK